MVRSRRERGAALVEFAVVLPFLALLVLGIIEFGWALGQMNDVRHGAREAARLAAVNAGSAATMRGQVCASMDLSSGQTVAFTDSASGDIGTEATVTVSAPVQSLSGAGIITVFLPPTLSSTVQARLEQPSDAWSTEAGVCP
jgi:Flp pilus assembly protein TadG